MFKMKHECEKVHYNSKNIIVAILKYGWTSKNQSCILFLFKSQRRHIEDKWMI